MPLMSEDQLLAKVDELKAKHKVSKLIYVKVPMSGGDALEFLCTCPTQPQHTAFRSKAKREDEAQADKYIADLCVKYPEAADYLEIQKQHPGITAPIAKKLLEEAGDLLQAESRTF